MASDGSWCFAVKCGVRSMFRLYRGGVWLVTAAGVLL